jgi:hypothetical protein
MCQGFGCVFGIYYSVRSRVDGLASCQKANTPKPTLGGVFFSDVNCGVDISEESVKFNKPPSSAIRLVVR